MSATLAPRDFATLDVDGDGLIDSAEAAADPILVERFAVLDLDDDDRLSREEFASYQPGPAAAVGE